MSPCLVVNTRPLYGQGSAVTTPSERTDIYNRTKLTMTFDERTLSLDGIA